MELCAKALEATKLQKTTAFKKKMETFGNFLVVQWLVLGVFTTQGLGSTLGWGTKDPQVVWHSQGKKKMETFKQSLNDHVSETIRWKIELGDNKDLF